MELMVQSPVKSRVETVDLARAADRVRERCVRMAATGGAFLGAALSAADLMTYLYGSFLRVTPESFATPDRDYFLLSKGHAVPALYGALVEFGFFEESRLARHLDPRDSIYWHPNRDVCGVDFHTGSLGHGLAVGVGIALDIRLRKRTDRVVVLLGDGELNEGSVWEALLVARAHRLENLIAVVDRNRLQANQPTESLVPLEPLVEKFRAFGCHVATCDGHSFPDIGRAFEDVRVHRDAPSVVIAHTIRGKGVPSLEGRLDAWYVDLDPEGLERCLRELSRTGGPLPRSRGSVT
jgi:transketolase